MYAKQLVIDILKKCIDSVSFCSHLLSLLYDLVTRSLNRCKTCVDDKGSN